MKLLLDENLSPALVAVLSAVFEGISHVADFNLKSAPDPIVWAYATNEGYTIVTKDSDFHHRSFLYGHPPRVIWIRRGNCSTKEIATLLMQQQKKIEEFHLSSESSFLVLD